MSFFKNLLIGSFLLSFGILFLNDVHAYDNEVWKSGSTYYWKINGVQAGSSSELHTAINSCMAQGRTVHVTTGGDLNGTISIPSWNVKLYCHNNTFNKTFSGYGISNGWDGFELYDLILRGGSNMGIRSSRGSNLRFVNIKIYDCGGIGMRIDSHPSKPYDYWVTNLYVQDCHFENISGHGLETYGIDGVSIWGIVAKNCSECGVLLNQSKNGTIGTVDAYRCCYEGGYAGLRFANNCDNITANMLYADECGRGFFVLSGSKNCTLKNCKITDCVDTWGTGRGIWMQDVSNCQVLSGCCNSGITVSGAGTCANVSDDCNSPMGVQRTCSDPYYHMQSRHSGHCISVQNGSVDNGADIIQGSCNSSYWRQQWQMVDVGSGYYVIRNRNSKKCMRASGDNVVQHTCYLNYWTEMFSREYTSDGNYIYRNRSNNKCLRIANSSTSSGASIVLDDCNTGWFSEQFERVTLKEAAEIELPSNIELFPSIVKNVLHINVQEELNNNAMVRIFNSNGAMILSKTLKNTNTLDLSGEPSGLYFVQLTHNNETDSYKIIKR